MKIFAIRNEESSSACDLAYLIYYEKDKRFYIELPDNADPWETPLLLESFVKRGQRTVNSYWSKLWVQQRIVPTDRQNLGQILKENGLTEYDEFELLMLADGRCAQDSFYLVSLGENELPFELTVRSKNKLEDIIPLNNNQLLCFFRDGTIRKNDISQLIGSDRRFAPILNDETLFHTVSLQPGGYGICWGENLCISDEELYNTGIEIPLALDDFKNFVIHRIATTAEATEILDCSRQNIDDLVQRGKLHPVKVSAKNKLFLISELLQRKWQ